MIVQSSATHRPILTLPARGIRFHSKKTKLNGGFLTFGEDDQYPQTIYNLIMASKTALAAANINADFTYGGGFEDASLMGIELGRNIFGQPFKMSDLLRSVCLDLSFFNGFYVKCSREMTNIITTYKPDFKKVRIGNPDDMENISTMVIMSTKSNRAVYDPYYTFTDRENVIIDRFRKDNDVYIPEIYCGFLNTENIYPISPVEAVALECDNEFQLSLLKNNSLRNGLSDKTLIMYKKQPESTDSSGNKIPNPIEDAVLGMLGADGDSIISIECESDNEGKLLKDIDTVQIPSNIKKDLTEGWTEEASNAIRLSFDGLPANILDAGLKTGITSESGKQLQISYEIYNQSTAYRREFVSKCFAEIFKQHKNPKLRNAQNWKITEKRLNISAIQ